MNRKGRKVTLTFRLLLLLSMGLVAFLSILLSLRYGAVEVGMREMLGILFLGEQSAHASIIWNIRLPRALVAALCGFQLAVAGLLLQGAMRNSMADPHLIGVSSGAGLLGILMILVYPAATQLVVPAAFIGALAAAMLVYALAWKRGASPVRIVLSGVAVSAFLNSGISGLLTFYSERVEGALSFLIGSLSARSWEHVNILWPYTACGIVVCMLLSSRMNVLSLGDEVARGLGMQVELTRFICLAVASLLAASAVSIIGMMGFVGLIVPHAARLLVGQDYRLLLPATGLLGIAVLSLADLAGRLLFAPVELAAGIVMGAVGGPFFLLLLRRRKPAG
ncbi:iron ABC transporter permease [Paenibacillus filicis]|uniref:Iron ABC transporter permease n=1 Tax=Paenibacillus filicis TaxID=669464 RepID=A0ABU9DUT7_9BACL